MAVTLAWQPICRPPREDLDHSASRVRGFPVAPAAGDRLAEVAVPIIIRPGGSRDASSKLEHDGTQVSHRRHRA